MGDEDWNFKGNFGGRGSTKREQEEWEARKYGTLKFPEVPKEVITPLGKAAGKPSGKRKKPTGRPLKYDRPEIQRLYEAGQTVPEIAVQVGANRDTVRRILKSLGVYQNKRDLGTKATGGRKKQERCLKGHDLTDKDNILWTTDNKTGRRKRECKTCKYKRTAAAKRRRNSSSPGT